MTNFEIVPGMLSHSELKDALTRALGRLPTETELAFALPKIEKHLNWLKNKRPQIWERLSHEQRLSMVASVASTRIRSAARRRSIHPLRRALVAVLGIVIVAFAVSAVAYLIFYFPLGRVYGTLAILGGAILGWRNARPEAPWETVTLSDRALSAFGYAVGGMYVLLMLMGLYLSGG